MSKRRVFGRARNVEVGEKFLYTFEMVKDRYSFDEKKLILGGVRFKRIRSREWTLVTFATIAEGNRMTRDVEGWPVSFVLGESGLEVRVKGEGGKRTIPFDILANLGSRQPLLLK